MRFSKAQTKVQYSIGFPLKVGTSGSGKVSANILSSDFVGTGLLVAGV